MEVVLAATPAAVGAIVADVVAELSPATIGVATGSSPKSAYAELVRRSAVTPQTGLYLLDEYIGLPAGDARRFRSTIERQLAGPLEIPAANVFGPDVDRADLDDAAEAYEQVIRSIGGVDVQICGIGRNGHLAFNEPGAPFDSKTRVVELSAATRVDNARFFDDADEVPCRAITQGLATILSASCIVLVAIGDAKAAAVAACLDGEPTTMVPATILQQHAHVVVVADAAAVSMATFARDRQESTP